MKIFHDNIETLKEKSSNLESLSHRLSVLRLLVFLGLLIAIVYLANARASYELWIIPLVLTFAFALLIKRYQKVARLKQHSIFLREINESEVLRLENKLQNFNPGKRFIDGNHPYTSDLDVFGQHSLYQLINRTTTESGEILLAQWLSVRSTKNEIIERQLAVKELSPNIEWRQDFQAEGLHFKNEKSDYEKLLKWVNTPVQLLQNRLKYFWASIALSLASITSVVLYFIHFGSSN